MSDAKTRLVEAAKAVRNQAEEDQVVEEDPWEEFDNSWAGPSIDLDKIKTISLATMASVRKAHAEGKASQELMNKVFDYLELATEFIPGLSSLI